MMYGGDDAEGPRSWPRLPTTGARMAGLRYFSAGLLVRRYHGPGDRRKKDGRAIWE